VPAPHRSPIHGCGRGLIRKYGVAFGPGARRTARARLRARPLARLVFAGIATPSLRESVSDAGYTSIRAYTDAVAPNPPPVNARHRDGLGRFGAAATM